MIPSPDRVPQPGRWRRFVALARQRGGVLTLGGLALLVIMLVDRSILGREPLVVHGIADEAAHALTACLWAAGANALGVRLVPLATVIGGTAIDLDHIPILFDWITAPAGTSRPGTHSLMTVALLLVLAGFDRSRRRWWASAALGLASHLWRDMGTGAVVLWWPYSMRAVSIPHVVYLAGMAFVFAEAVFWGMRTQR